MKHLVKSLVLFSFLLINCNKQEENKFSIEGITDFDDEKIIYMLTPEKNMTIPVDSAKIVNGKFKMNGKVSSPNLNYLSIDGLNIPFILENGNIKAKIYKDSISVSKFSGTISNEDFYIFNQKSRELSNSYNNIIIEMNQANNLGDDILVTDLQDQAKLLQQKFFNFQKNFMRENINSYISALILEGFTVSKTLPIDSLKLFYNGLTQRIKKTSSGLSYIITKNGNGPKISSTNKAKAHYAVYFENGNLLDTSMLEVAENLFLVNEQKKSAGGYTPILCDISPEAQMISGFK